MQSFAGSLGELVKLIGTGELSGKLAKEISRRCFPPARPAAVIMEREGLKQISDTGAPEKIITDVIDVIANNPAGGAVPGRQDHRDQLPGRSGDESHARPLGRGFRLHSDA
jgi:hypothetical protein